MKWQKGQSGNPAGRKPGSIAADFRKLLVKRFGKSGGKLLTRLEQLAQSNNPRVALAATELMLAYLLGKPTQMIDLNADVTVDALRVVIDGPPPA
jgi:hypothetical protein